MSVDSTILTSVANAMASIVGRAYRHPTSQVLGAYAGTGRTACVITVKINGEVRWFKVEVSECTSP